MISKLKVLISGCLLLVSGITLPAQNALGKWKLISETTIFDGKAIDMHKSLVQGKPRVDNIIYEFTEDGNARLIASNSGCDAEYIRIQEKLWSKMKWKVLGDTIKTSTTNFAIANNYILSFKSSTMIWNDEYGGTMIYQKQ